MYKAKVVTFDNVNIGDNIKRNGIVYRVAAKIVDGLGGYLELRMTKNSKFDMHRDVELWTKKDFDSRRFRACKND